MEPPGRTQRRLGVGCRLAPCCCIKMRWGPAGRLSGRLVQQEQPDLVCLPRGNVGRWGQKSAGSGSSPDRSAPLQLLPRHPAASLSPPLQGGGLSRTSTPSLSRSPPPVRLPCARASARLPQCLSVT